MQSEVVSISGQKTTTAAYVLGMQVEVFSKTAGRWRTGKIIEVHDSKGTVRAKYNFTKDGETLSLEKTLPIKSTQLRPLGREMFDEAGGMFDEAELEAEFADLEEELLDEQLLDIVSPPRLSLPAVPPSPMAGRTFANSNFHAAYAKAKAPTDLIKLGSKLGSLIEGYCTAHDIPYDDDEGETFLDQLKADMSGGDESVPQAVQRMWTSYRNLRGREFCAILNEAARSDELARVKPAAALTRAINELCVTPDGEEPRPPFPPEFLCFRGGGFDEKYRDFFAPGREFRQPAFLATSFLASTAEDFIARSDMPVKAKWLIRIDPARKCRHVNRITRRVPDLPDEQEYLFAPYSAFTVLSARWGAGTVADPHVIELQAAPDNKGPSEDLPLAPWS
jgi:ribosomal protein L35AE/L33A